MTTQNLAVQSLATISISEVTIRQDSEGRYCLNDLHHAAGGKARHRPSQWVENIQTQDLANEIAKAGIPALVSVRGGNAPGTFAVRELVYAYAMWISPSFHLKVIRIFDAVVSNQHPTPPSTPKALAALDLRAELDVAAMLGCPLHLAQIEAVKVIRKYHNIDFSHHLLNASAQIGIKHEDVMLEPTEIGKVLGITANNVNKGLEAAGLQIKVGGVWVATEKGAEISIRHAWSKGAKSGYNYKWRLDAIREYLV